MEVLKFVFLLMCSTMCASKPVDNFGVNITKVKLQQSHPILCEYKGLTFFPGEDIYIDHVGCKHTGIKCGVNGNITMTSKYDCSIISTINTESKSPTTPPPTKDKPGCHYEGVFYNPGELISEVKHDDWCYGVICSSDAQIIHWDNFECNSTVTTTTPPEMTTNIPLAACQSDGMIYLPGEVVSEYEEKDKCIQNICDLKGILKTEKDGPC